ncbi:MAG: chorismate mutase [Gammaproteobacteria bacterium]|nr:chorismate mutase [Gammaproteobacteria bacterium]MDE0246430.1 chorismate mutase [Gammaproteobacteria bacterium]MDE0394074.1 chorismate mutase [Gammaproteobacteria bacterium]
MATDHPPREEHATGEDASREALERVRARIADVDERLIRMIGERRALVLEVGRLKAVLGLPVLDPAQEAKVVRSAAVRARELGVDEEATRDVIWRIIASARATQEGRPAGWPDPGGDSG